jgi:hypothetical protein
LVATAGGELVARHARAWGRHQVLTDPLAVAAETSSVAGARPWSPGTAEVEKQDLAVHDGLGAA